MHRPVIGSCPSPKSSSSAIALAESSKRIIQITRFLEDRHLAFSLCLNKDELLTLCGLTLLYQRLDFEQDGRLLRDGQELVQEVIISLTKSNANGATDFTKLALSMGIEGPRKSSADVESGILSPNKQETATSSPAKKRAGNMTDDVTQTQNQSQHGIITALPSIQIDNVSSSDLSNRTLEHTSFLSENPTPPTPFSQLHPNQLLPPSQPQQNSKSQSKSTRLNPRNPNLDYLHLDETLDETPDSHTNHQSKSHQKQSQNKTHSAPASARPSSSSRTPSSTMKKKERKNRNSSRGRSTSTDSWERMPILGSVDEARIYDAMYGGTSLPLSLCAGRGSLDGDRDDMEQERWTRSGVEGSSTMDGLEWNPIVGGQVACSWDVSVMGTAGFEGSDSGAGSSGNGHGHGRGLGHGSGLGQASTSRFNEENLSAGEAKGQNMDRAAGNGPGVDDRMDYQCENAGNGGVYLHGHDVPMAMDGFRLEDELRRW